MSKPLYLGTFQVFGSPSKRGIASWQLPEADLMRFHELDYWIQTARLLEDSGFDFMFFADGYSYPTLDGEITDAAAKYGINIPILDPQLLIPSLAHATSHLGFVVTETTSIHAPIETARRFATLDHLSGGRVGMNIVTGGVQNTMADLFGWDDPVGHDERYDRADEYIDIARAYWENSWGEGAWAADPQQLVAIDRSRLRKVEFNGTYLRSSGYLNVDPSPQRTPVLVQAGTSGRGRAFAGRNAEVVLIQGTTTDRNRTDVADIRRAAQEQGRAGDSIRTMVTATIVVGDTHDEAVARRRVFDAAQDDEVAAATYYGITGIDLLALERDLPLFDALERYRSKSSFIGKMNVTNIDRFRPRPGETPKTVAEIIDELRGRGIRGYQLTGDPVEVADQLEQVMDETDLDGILLDPIWGLQDIRDFARLVQPELQRRGRIADRSGAATLRQRLS